MQARALSSMALALAATALASCGGSAPSNETSVTTRPPTSTTSATASTNPPATYQTVTEPDGFKFGLRVGQRPVLSAVQGDGSDSNYPAAPPGQDWVLVTLNVRNDQSDRPAQLADLLDPPGNSSSSQSGFVGVTLPVDETPQVKGQCQQMEYQVPAPGGYCYLLADINFSDGSFYQPVLGGAPQIPPGGEVTINLYSGPVASGTSLSGVKVWVMNESTWTFVPTP